MAERPKRIKLMADFSADALWMDDPADPEYGANLDPTDFPLQPKTIERLRRWADTYEESLKWDHTGSISWSTAEEAVFEQAGICLWHQLRHELAPTFEVVYFSETRRRVLTHPDELAEP